MLLEDDTMQKNIWILWMLMQHHKVDLEKCL
jgi:hypothetical protein